MFKLHRFLLASVALIATPAFAQDKCATVAVASAKTDADKLKLATDAECYAKAANSAITSQALRIKKLKELLAAPVVVVPTPPPAPTPLPAPIPLPTPTPPPPHGPGDAVPISGLPIVASNFDITKELVPAWGTGELPVSGVPDVVGAFRFICQAGQLSYNDPIVYPGKKGKSHLHQFFGNTGADENSTYDSLRTSGDSTCMSKANRSGYWMPAMMNGKGKVVRPDYVSIYYKRVPNTDPDCTSRGHKGCVDIPRGLKFIFGYDMLTGLASTGGGYFNCDGPGAVSGHFPDIATAAKNCPIGARLGAVISAPDCWNGKDLDSPNHRDHMAYRYDPHTDGHAICPATHPYVIPTFTMGAWYSVDDTLDHSGVWDGKMNSWHLSSDEKSATMPMDMNPGTTFHADWFGAWDDEVLKLWHDNCINKLLNCSGGVLGNGQQMKQAYPDSWVAVPHLADVPAG